MRRTKSKPTSALPKTRNFLRRLEALRLVSFKLDKLEQHVKSGRRLLNDLRTLRRLLLDEREEPAPKRNSFCLLVRSE